jgi:hypothetical protein
LSCKELFAKSIVGAKRQTPQVAAWGRQTIRHDSKSGRAIRTWNLTPLTSKLQDLHPE